MREVVLVGAVRTAIGKFGGNLTGVSVVQMGKIVIEEALKRAGVPAAAVDEVIMGNVLQAGLGQGTARQSSVYAGIPETIPAMTINKICGSGLKAVNIAAALIMAGEADIIVAGGMENMSNAPYLVPQARWGVRMGGGTIEDYMLKDGLWDAFNNYHMGITAENVAEMYHISREEQDEFSAWSQQKTISAIKEGRFKEEIVPVEIPQKNKESLIFQQDESPREGVTVDLLAKLKPAFKKDGTVTAGNASGINDGAAAIVVMASETADKMGIKPMAKIVSCASVGVDPQVMGIGPVPATRKALSKAGLSLNDIQLIEANEAFASQALAVSKEIGWDMKKVNVNGGAIALGHPIGASGTRILVTLLHEMQRRELELGLATLCVGGGMGVATIVKRI